ncbi:MAG: porin [Methylotenera sp.]|nr:porin [Methylotenera sp.]MDP1755002.1 porin [Methylotenera sp.]MDP1958391.1 porin [Methylotenera sp.]MDP3943624.1 porin [Methylotenera sp.]
MNYKLRGILAAALAGSVLMGFGTQASADSTTDIVNALISKGVLTEEEGALLTKGRDGEVETQKKKEKKQWSNKLSIRGYLQTRNTTMLGGDDVGVNLFSDRSVGNDRSLGDQDKNFLIRRARVVISGDVGDHLGIYIQPDFASSAGTTGNLGQLRDFYGDFNLTKNKVHRIRVGQSKVPYGFENLQSSQNRLALDRADALNSAVKDERDLGAFYYYTPETTQALFKEIADLGLKHSGNYGQFALGAYNGQGANNREQNDNYHIVARYTHPWKTETGQIYEAGIQGYSGNYVVTPTTYRRNAAAAAGTTVTPTILPADRNGIKDERVAVSFMMNPQPFGLQGEWNWGKTPGLDATKGTTGTIEEQSLNGGYVQAMYKIDNFKFLDTNGTLIPFVKWQYFDGYNKAESNAAKNNVNDWEIGAEWQIAPEVELVAYYHRMKRSNLITGARANATVAAQGGPATDYETFSADALRVQLQFNY